MENQKVLTVEVLIEETETVTDAKAVMAIGSRSFGGWGRARRNPTDANVPQIGEELATARALSDLAHKLLDAAADAIEDREGHPVRVHE
jgi:hypothetical protein